MPQTSFAMMTNLGRAKEAAALANAGTVTITHIAIGDGNTVPSGGETALYNEVARKTISGHGTVVGATDTAYFDCFLAAEDGPYTIREAGLIDDDGDLIAIARYDPPVSKPIPASGQTVEGTIRLEVQFSDIANVTIVVDPAMQVALQRLTRLPWIPVLSMTTAAPPATPAVGDVYLIPTGATGAWSAQDGKIAEYTVAGWALIDPPNGHGISLPDGRVFERVGGAYVQKIAIDVQSGKWIYAVAGGTADALTVTLDPPLLAYAAGLALRIKITAANTDAVTININGLGAKSVTRKDGSDLAANDLRIDDIATVIYDGAAFRLASFARSDLLAAAFQPVTTVKITATGAYSWTVPDGVHAVMARAWGGGGGGGYSANEGAGSGGSAGAYAERRFLVSPGDTITGTVGVGGLGGAQSPAREGQPGTDTTVTVDGVTITAGGGPGGLNSTTLGVVADSPGSSSYSNADFGIPGGRGFYGMVGHGPQAYGGNGGAAPLGGAATMGGVGGASEGAVPGGGAAAGGDGSFAGGIGARGEVHFIYATGA